MPPIRTISTNKPLKTERTHEENQERAYIAASRRSDRSLEARIESARRASEIHKKRTGRALRVTEQDVVNEEMYEEEDEDLPAQIRRLQQFAHLQTNSDNFNYRLHNYMASHIGTRQALMDQTFPNTPFFSNQFAPPQQNTMLPPQMFHYNQGYRQGMNPSPQQNFSGQSMHQRPSSISTQHGMPYMQSNPASPMTPQGFDQRRSSMPPQQSPIASKPQTPMRPSVSRKGSNGSDGNTAPQFTKAQDSPLLIGTSGMGYPATTGPLLDGTQGGSLAPFSTSLPAETQQLLVSPASMGAENAFSQYLFSNPMPSVSYSYKPNSTASMPTTTQGLSIDPTMSMPPLDSINSPNSASYATSANTDFGYFGTDGMFGDNMKFSNMTSPSSHGDGGDATPGGTDWQNFIDTSFDDNVGVSAHAA